MRTARVESQGLGRPDEPSLVPPGYKRTEVGLLPDDWGLTELGQLYQFTNGVNADKEAYGSGVPFVNVLEVVKHSHLGHSEIPGRVELPSAVIDSFTVRRGDIVLNRTSETQEEVGLASIYDDDHVVVFGGFVIRGRPVGDAMYPPYVGYGLRASAVRTQITARGQGAIRANIGQASLREVLVPVPPKPEQRTIATALLDVDRLIAALDRLIAKKRAVRGAAMQRLLTGRTRLPGFSGEWETKQIADIARPCSEKNSSSGDLPVLTCSKHVGFVDSLGYFKNQVFSRDLSGYKVIRRGQIGYPANHIEEGSIGLQDLYDVALVSPIYVVCAPNDGVNSYFLHRLLKLDSYRQVFAAATTSSVDRRGSLRWPAFSDIAVTLPPVEEQEAIAAVLSDMDAEIENLERRHEKTKQIKQGMMQQLLTGRARLVKPKR